MSLGLKLSILPWCVALLGAVAACSSEPPPDPPTFDDHTLPGLESLEQFTAFADLGTPPLGAKFVLTQFSGPGKGLSLLLDPKFYFLHDEWYWFRLLNGQSVDGVEVEPLTGLHFATVQEVYDTYRNQTPPLGLRWAADGKRLYSNAFYDMTSGWCPPGGSGAEKYRCAYQLGAGTLMHFDANPKRKVPQELWAFELDFYNEPSEADMGVFFTRVMELLPPGLGPQLVWVARSAYQEALANQIRAGTGPYAKRVLTWSDLVVAGEVQGYTTGLTAGRLRRVPKGGFGIASLQPTDIVVLSEIPDEMPPVAGIVTAVPQTPQAHLNLLAAARGTPNVYIGGILDDPAWTTWASDGTPIALEVREHEMRWKALTPAEWQQWLARSQGLPTDLVPADLAGMPTAVDLAQGNAGAMRGLLSTIGGKSSGMMALLGTPGIETPSPALGLSVLGYATHIQPIEAALQQLLQASVFASYSQIRYLLLEGRDAFLAAHATDPSAMAWLAWFDNQAHEPVVQQFVDSGGVRQAILDLPMDATWLQAAQEALAVKFGDLSVLQGLRFRSSSTAEDVDGFNGAGVYASYTGFLDPSQQPKPKEKLQSVEQAVKLVWASYWTYGAFEERRMAGIPHLKGRMGVLVHPRFDDTAEAANGVLLLAVRRDPGGDAVEMTVNVQKGSTSVTNPVPGTDIAPEIDRVSALTAGSPKIARLQVSSLVQDGQPLLSDAELTAMLEEARWVAAPWLAAADAGVEPAAQLKTLVLDMEFRKVHQGWPALKSGQVLPARLVWKQVRPLSRPSRIPLGWIGNALVPRDVLAVTRQVEERSCQTPHFHVESLEFYTDPNGELLGGGLLIDHAVQPFTAWVHVTFPKGVTGLGIPPGPQQVLLHTQAAFTHPKTTALQWDLNVAQTPGLPGNPGWTRLTVDDKGAWMLETPTGKLQGTDGQCSRLVTVQSKEAWLAQILGPG